VNQKALPILHLVHAQCSNVCACSRGDIARPRISAHATEGISEGQGRAFPLDVDLDVLRYALWPQHAYHAVRRVVVQKLGSIARDFARLVRVDDHLERAERVLRPAVATAGAADGAVLDLRRDATP
jgi:hypothetical protein